MGISNITKDSNNNYNDSNNNSNNNNIDDNSNNNNNDDDDDNNSNNNNNNNNNNNINNNKEVDRSYLTKCPNGHAQCIASDSQSPAPGLPMAEVFGTNSRRGDGKELTPLNNQCFGQVEFVSLVYRST